MKKCMILLLLLLTICLLSACKGNALPDEMNEEELLSAGENILQMLTSGNCQGVYEACGRMFGSRPMLLPLKNF